MASSSAKWFATGTLIIIKRISRAPTYHTRWQHRALYNNTNHTHTVSNKGMGRAVENSLEIIIKQVHLEGGFEREGRISVSGNCSRQMGQHKQPGDITPHGCI